MKKTVSTLVIIAILVTAQQASAESWLSKTFGPNGSAFKMLGASVMNITSVDSVQKKLIDAGALKGVATGVADEQTVNAVKTFQATNNLKVDGVVGKETLKVLDPVVAAGITLPPGVKPTPTKNDGFDKLCLDGQPHVKVISPNGGEVFSAGQQVQFIWKTCNHASSEPVEIDLNGPVVPGVGPRFIATTTNTGSYTFNLPTSSAFPNMQFGNLYKAQVIVNNQQDLSDNFFTISAGIPVTAVCPNPRLTISYQPVGSVSLSKSAAGISPSGTNSGSPQEIGRFVLQTNCDMKINQQTLNLSSSNASTLANSSQFNLYQMRGNNTLIDQQPPSGTNWISFDNMDANGLLINANQPKSISIWGSPKGSIQVGSKTQVCLGAPQKMLDMNGNLIPTVQFPANNYSVIGGMTCGDLITTTN